MSDARLIKRLSALGFAAMAGIVVGALTFKFSDLTGNAALVVGGFVAVATCAVLSFGKKTPRYAKRKYSAASGESLYSVADSFGVSQGSGGDFSGGDY